MATNLLGLHGQRNTPATEQAIRAMRNVGVAKFLPGNFTSAGIGAITEFQHNNPNALKIVRDVDNQAPGKPWRQIMERSLRRFEAVDNLWDVMEYPVNEACQRGDPLKRLADDTLKAIEWFKEKRPDKDLVVANFSHGTLQMGALDGYDRGTLPEDGWKDWRTFLPVVRAAKYMGLHEYSAPSMQDGIGWHCLRYRRPYDWFVREAGLSQGELPLLLINECGIDRGWMKKKRSEAGWKGIRIDNPYPEQVAAYVKDLLWYNEEINKDWYVRGATIFILGGYSGGESGWQSFEIEDHPDIIDVLNRPYDPMDRIVQAIRPKPVPIIIAGDGRPARFAPPETPSVFLQWEGSHPQAHKEPTRGRRGFERFVEHLLELGIPPLDNESSNDFALRFGFPDGDLIYYYPTWQTKRIPDVVIPTEERRPEISNTPAEAISFGLQKSKLQTLLGEAQMIVDSAHGFEEDQSDLFIRLANATDLRGALPVREGVEPFLLRTFDEMAEVKWFVIHHTGALQRTFTAIEVANYHSGLSNEHEFPGFSYHIFVTETGEIQLCQDIARLVWSNGYGSPGSKRGVGVYNWWSTAVCFSGRDPNEKQLAALERCYQVIANIFSQEIDLKGHNDLSSTACPGDVATKWVNERR